MVALEKVLQLSLSNIINWLAKKWQKTVLMIIQFIELYFKLR